MNRRIISSILISTFLSMLGCYPYKSITKEELNQAEDLTDLQIITKNQYIYEFDEGNYKISEDSIYGTGKLKLNMGKEVKEEFKGSVPFEDIKELKMDEFDVLTTILAVVIPVAVMAILLQNYHGPGL